MSASELATRDGYGHGLLALGAERPEVVVLDADLSRSTRTEWFAKKYPDRFFNLGIAEANMIGVAAGMARVGLIPFATTYAIFAGRAYDQIRQSVAFPRRNAKIVATHAGLAASHDGGSHQGIEDMALMRAVPGMTVIAPLDAHQTAAAVRALADFEGPAYMRIAKEPSPVLTREGSPFEIGALYPLREGRNVTFLATGVVAGQAMIAAELLEREGVSARVIGVPTVKPLDGEALAAACRGTDLVVTVEEHTIVGGLGSAVLEAICDAGAALAPLLRCGIPDCFTQTGHWHELLDHYGLSGPKLAERALGALAERRLP